MASILGELFAPVTRRGANIIDDALTDFERSIGLKRPSRTAEEHARGASASAVEEAFGTIVPELIDTLLTPARAADALPWRLYLATALADGRGPVAVGIVAVAQPRVMSLWRVRTEDGEAGQTFEASGGVRLTVPPGGTQAARFWEVADKTGTVRGVGRVSLAHEMSGVLVLRDEQYPVSFRPYTAGEGDFYRTPDPRPYMASILGGAVGGVSADAALGLDVRRGEESVDQEASDGGGEALIPYEGPRSSTVKNVIGVGLGTAVAGAVLWWLFG